MDEFHVSREVATLGLSTFVIGLAVGPMMLAPLSEVLRLLSSRLPWLANKISAVLWAEAHLSCLYGFICHMAHS